MDDLVGERGRRGIGDNRIGAQYRLHRQTGRLPTLAVSYALKVPTASEEIGLGSGQNDHQFKFLPSQDLRGPHLHPHPPPPPLPPPPSPAHAPPPPPPPPP